MKNLYHRKSLRLQGYDYTQSGAYFVTICAHHRLHLFGEIQNGEMLLSSMGNIVYEQWCQTGILRDYVELDMFVIMPNHVHGIIMILNTEMESDNLADREFSRPIAKSLSTIIGAFKASVTRHVNRLPNTPDHPIWQRNFHDHIIRNSDDLDRLREYVLYNPARWKIDTFYDKDDREDES